MIWNNKQANERFFAVLAGDDAWDDDEGSDGANEKMERGKKKFFVFFGQNRTTKGRLTATYLYISSRDENFYRKMMMLPSKHVGNRQCKVDVDFIHLDFSFLFDWWVSLYPWKRICAKFIQRCDTNGGHRATKEATESRANQAK